MPDVDALLNSLQSRVPWDTARKILVSLDLPRARGWENTVPGLLSALAEDDAAAQDLEAALIEHIHCGEKSIAFYRVSQTARDELLEYCRGLTAEETSYPYLLSQEELDAADLGTPQIVAVEEKQHGFDVVYSSVREYVAREELNAADLPADSDLFERFSEVVGFRRERSQAFDVVRIRDNSRRVEIRLDNPKGTSREAIGTAQAQLLALLETGIGEKLPDPVNLFPLIRRIYNVANEGMIVELSFILRAGSIHNERMRRRRSCLRTELYHSAGMTALGGQFDAFRMSAQWRRNHGGENVSRPELSLNGTVHLLHSAQPFLGEAIVRGCISRADYNFVRGKIRHYLSVTDD